MAYVDAATLFSTTHVDLGDTPGYPAGTKAVGFGEVLTSRNTNRITYALALNIDHVWGNLTLDNAYRVGDANDTERGRIINVDGGAVELRGGEFDDQGGVLRVEAGPSAKVAVDVKTTSPSQMGLVARSARLRGTSPSDPWSEWEASPSNSGADYIGLDPSSPHTLTDAVIPLVFDRNDIVEVRYPDGSVENYLCGSASDYNALFANTRAVRVRNLDGTAAALPVPIPPGTRVTLYKRTVSLSAGDGPLLSIGPSALEGSNQPLARIVYQDEIPLAIYERLRPGGVGSPTNIPRLTVFPRGSLTVEPRVGSDLDQSWGGLQSVGSSWSPGVVTKGIDPTGESLGSVNLIRIFSLGTVSFGSLVGDTRHIQVTLPAGAHPRASYLVVGPGPTGDTPFSSTGVVLQIIRELPDSGYTHVARSIHGRDLTEYVGTSREATLYQAVTFGRVSLEPPNSSTSFSGQTTPGDVSAVIPVGTKAHSTGLVIAGQRAGAQYLLKGLVSGNHTTEDLDGSGQDEVFLLDNEGSFYAAGSGWVDDSLFVTNLTHTANLDVTQNAFIWGDLTTVGDVTVGGQVIGDSFRYSSPRAASWMYPLSGATVTAGTVQRDNGLPRINTISGSSCTLYMGIHTPTPVVSPLNAERPKLTGVRVFISYSGMTSSSYITVSARLERVDPTGSVTLVGSASHENEGLGYNGNHTLHIAEDLSPDVPHCYQVKIDVVASGGAAGGVTLRSVQALASVTHLSGW